MKFLRAGGTLAPYAPASLVVAVAAVASLAMPRSAVAEPTSNADVEQLLASAEVDIGNAVVDLRNIEIKGQVEQADKLTQDALREVKHTIAVLHRAAHEPSPASSPKHAQFAGNSSAPPSAGAAPPATSTAVAERSTPAASHEASQPGENQPVGTRISDAQSAREQTAPGQPTAGATSSGGSSGTTAAPTSTAPPLVGVVVRQQRPPPQRTTRPAGHRPQPVHRPGRAQHQIPVARLQIAHPLPRMARVDTLRHPPARLNQRTRQRRSRG